MTVLFRVEASSEIGSGHLMRCLALAQCLVLNHVEVIFAVQAGTAKLCKERHDWVGKILSLPQLSDSDEQAWLAQVIQAHQVDILVLDGYQFTHAYREKIAALPCLMAVFDDTNAAPHLVGDVIINGAPKAMDMGYVKTAPHAVLCLGHEYRVMRQEFTFIHPHDWETRQSLLITMGGSDVNNMTLPVLKTFEQILIGDEHAALHVPIRVVTGSGYQELEVLRHWLRETPLNVQHIHECQQMAEVMVHAKLAISAAGGSQFELLACATPSVLAVVADNQIPATSEAATQGWCESIDCREKNQIQAICKRTLKLWQAPKTLDEMHEKALLLIDTQGAERVVKALFEALNSDNDDA